MFEHLDDPVPPVYDAGQQAAVARRVSALRARRRHHRQILGSVALIAAVATGGAAYGADHHRSAVNLIVGPTTTTAVPPACASPPAGDRPVTVYNQPRIRIGWLPAGYRLVSGTAVAPNNNNPLTYQPLSQNPPQPTATTSADPTAPAGRWIQITFEVGTSADIPTISMLKGFAGEQFITINGRPASAYTPPAPNSGQIEIEWSPQTGVAVGVNGNQESLAALERVAQSVATQLGPPTVITATTYLGPVIPLARVLTGLSPSDRGPGYSPGEPLAARLATYGELMATPGQWLEGRNPQTPPDGTPVWVIYDQRAVEPDPPTTTASLIVINALTGQMITAAETSVNQFAWISKLPDHQNISPCETATAPATPGHHDLAHPDGSGPAKTNDATTTSTN